MTTDKRLREAEFLDDGGASAYNAEDSSNMDYMDYGGEGSHNDDTYLQKRSSRAIPQHILPQNQGQASRTSTRGHMVTPEEIAASKEAQYAHQSSSQNGRLSQGVGQEPHESQSEHWSQGNGQQSQQSHNGQQWSQGGTQQSTQNGQQWHQGVQPQNEQWQQQTNGQWSVNGGGMASQQPYKSSHSRPNDQALTHEMTYNQRAQGAPQQQSGAGSTSTTDASMTERDYLLKWFPGALDVYNYDENGSIVAVSNTSDRKIIKRAVGGHWYFMTFGCVSSEEKAKLLSNKLARFKQDLGFTSQFMKSWRQ